MDAPTVSVIIPVYNLSDCVTRCLQSVMTQSYSAFECVIVDDASTDDSMERCEQMIKEYHGLISFRILRHQRNRGLSAARNTGTDAATGEYILYVDGDDVITSDCIEKLRRPLLMDDTIEMVMGDYVQYNDSSQYGTHPRSHFPGDFPSPGAVRSCYYENRICEAAWNKLVRRSFLLLNGISFREGIIWEDLLWSFYVMKYLKHMYLIEDVTYAKYVRQGSICSATDKPVKLYNYGLVFDEITRSFTPDDCRREARYYLRDFCNKYVYCPQDETYKKIALRFKRELSFFRDARLYLKLLLVGLFSTTSIGEKVYRRI